MKRLLFLIITCSSFALQAQVNEICNNGFDEDGDGFIDCFDSDCSNDPVCDGNYIGNIAACQSPPSQFPKFTMALDWESPNEVVNHLNRISIGDLDRDGIPEVVSINVVTNNIFILNGADGKIKVGPLNVNYSLEREAIIGNIDNDNCAEIFTYGKRKGVWRIYAYDCQLNLLWSSPAGSEMLSNPYYLSLADFDGDGKAEIYYKDEIVDAKTGVKIVSTTQATKTDGSPAVDGSGNPLYVYNYVAAPVAADILGDGKLELIAGGRIYDVNLGARTLNSGSLTLLKKIDQFRIRSEQTSTTSVADYNLDGFLDVLITGSNYTGTSTNITSNTDQNTTLFFWDVQSDVVKTYIDAFNTNVNVYDCQTVDASGNYIPTTGPYYQNGWRNGTGRINIADIDGDGKLNAVYVSGKFLYALKEDFTQKWRIVVNEETSGYTGCTMFDFNGDGQTEIVYRDEKFVYIIYGDGTVSNAQKCVSRTNREYPIVADVDADGSTEICVTCASDDNLSDKDFCNGGTVGNQQYSVVRAFKSGSEPWVPARRVWNQHGYFNVNVSDNLTIPKQQQKSQTVFFDGACRPGDPIKKIRPLNNFLNQSPFLDTRGCPQYAAPNLEILGVVNVQPPTCPDKDFTVSFTLTNTGDLSMTGDVPITFYKGDPSLAGSVKLNTILKTLNAFGNGATTAVNTTVKGDGSNFVLFIALNDAGTSTPPVVLPNTNFLECDYSFFSAQVSPLSVGIATTSTPNVQCLSNPATANGSASASIVVNSIDISNNFNFYWSNGSVAKPIPADYKGATYTGLIEQDYTVFAIHKTANCSSNTKVQTVARVDGNITVQVVLDNSYTNCKAPNGALRAIVNGGAPVGNFTYAWYQGNTVLIPPVLGNGDIFSGLTPATYSVFVTDKATGCSTPASLNVPDNTVKPVATATPVDMSCNATNGSITANISGGPSGFNFKWYNGIAVKPVPDFSGAGVAGSVYSPLAAGNYVLVVEDNVSKCDSDPVPAVVNQTLKPVLNNPTVLANMTSCDATLPNGSASVSVQSPIVGHTYTIEWFTGQNTLLANRRKIDLLVTNSTITNLPTGIFTIKLTDNITGCSSTKEVTISFAVVTPTLNSAVGDLTNCTTPDGSVTVNVTLDTPADYTFSWYIGSSVKATPDFADTDNKLENLPIGKYTVKAVHKTKNCVTAPISADIIDNTPVININVDASVTVPPSDCNSNNGVMKVDVSASGNTNGFRIEWYSGFNNTGPLVQTPEVGVNTSTASSLPTGLYNIVATNLDNGCLVKDTFNLPFAHAHKLLFDSQVDVSKCSPTDEGMITVMLKKTNDLVGFTFFESDYVIEVRNGTTETGSLVQPLINGVDAQLLYSTINTLDTGYYNLIAISNNPGKPNFGCKSVPVIVKINQNVTYPVIVAKQIDANMNCAGATANGKIELDIDGVAVPESDFTYQWFEGNTITSPVLGSGTTGNTTGSGEIAQNLPPSFYTVKVSNNITLCPSIATFQVFDNPPIISLASADIALTDVLFCSNPNGASATVNSMSENGAGVGTANYSFQWLDNNLNVLPIAGIPNTTNLITNLAAGSYFVRATKNAGVTGLSCFSALTGFEILDKTINSIGVNLVSFVVPSFCLKPSILGELTAKETGVSNAGFTFTWYEGVNDLAPILGTGTTGTTGGLNGEIAQSLPSGTYTVKVVNNQTSCTITDTYTLPLDTAVINLVASTLPITFCAPSTGPDDGVVNATVTNLLYISDRSLDLDVIKDPSLPGDYDYFWTSTTGNFTGQKAINKPKGDYFVQAVAKSNAVCKSNTVKVTLVEEIVYPTVTALEAEPVSNCDATIPNGIASASVGDDIINYIFDWYEGAPTTPAGANFIFEGPEASDLKPAVAPTFTFYSVIAKNRITNCMDTTTIKIDYIPMDVPLPSVELVSNVTNCVIQNYTPNGALKVVIDHPSDYTFTWTKTGDLTFADNGEIIDALDAGNYVVTALNIASRCSSSAPGDVIIKRVTPSFGFTTVDAACGEDNGFASLYITNTEAIQIESITWDFNGVNVEGPILSEVPVGTYHVKVITSLNCSAEADVTIGTEVLPYNGISRSTPGANDFFKINCIESFENNLVKIYNRAGTLVYEATNYNNQTTYFDGTSNKGISLMGTNLPAGTYFYIIDKRNGSKRLAGYLEIVN